MNDGWGISYEIALRWMSLDLTDDKSTLVHVMAWGRQAPSHYLSQCWPRSMSPNGVTRPQWVNSLRSPWERWRILNGHFSNTLLWSIYFTTPWDIVFRLMPQNFIVKSTLAWVMFGAVIADQVRWHHITSPVAHELNPKSLIPLLNLNHDEILDMLQQCCGTAKFCQ